MKGDTIKDMLKPRSELDTVQVGFLLLNDFSLLAFSAAVEPLRAANRLVRTEQRDRVRRAVADDEVAEPRAGIDAADRARVTAGAPRGADLGVRE